MGAPISGGKGEPSTSGHHFGVGLPCSSASVWGGLCLNILAISHRFLSCHLIHGDPSTSGKALPP